jgi:tetratricopeptide (TPR) repeat protein
LIIEVVDGVEGLEGLSIIIIMSNTEERGDGNEVCASCGGAKDNVQTRKCNSCQYRDFCQYQKEKSERQRAEIRDDPLFTPPPEISHLGDCPICLLPLPLDEQKWRINACCCKLICIGCSYANEKRERREGLEHKCTYCRSLLPKSQEEAAQMMIPRVKANDPIALLQMGGMCDREGDHEEAIQYYTKAAELGDMDAHYNLSISYHLGRGVEKDETKQKHHLEKAAIGGHHLARYNLGCIEDREIGTFHRANQHWIIAANLGYDKALKQVKRCYSQGYARKDQFEAALRGHQAAVDATKSQQRTEAEAFYAIFNAGN